MVLPRIWNLWGYCRMLVLLLVFCYIVSADDQFLCCMAGIKKVRHISICPAPCCHGYEEHSVYTAMMAQISFCRKVEEDTSQELTPAVREKWGARRYPDKLFHF
ncbi:uncharacterized protein LOC128245512 [Mya arenaria]|uniref:uncharacterized protein LOC128245512 n=1 Tax=Mya arenaria TaxID=6604 RepID=UPI0022E20778|nr:uncharacterized protein LOC128245512 [Mya arenaria]